MTKGLKVLRFISLHERFVKTIKAHNLPIDIKMYTDCLKSKCTDFPMDELEM
jgi:hypothetical protein